MMETDASCLMQCFLLGVSSGILLKFLSLLIYATVKSLLGIFRNITR